MRSSGQTLWIGGDAATDRSLDAMTDAAVAAAWRDIYRPPAGVALHPAALGRLPTRADVAVTARALACAVAAGSKDYFVAHVRRMAHNQADRGAPVFAVAAVVAALRRFYAEGADPAVTARALPVLDAGLTEAERWARAVPDANGPAHQSSPSEPPLPNVDALTDALLAGRIEACRYLVQGALDGGHGCLDVATRLIQPALYEVGDRWQQRRITVAEEHGATAVAAALLAELFAVAPRAEPVGRTALIAPVIGNRHVIGPHMVADAFELAGWDTHFLGAGATEDDLFAEIHHRRPDLLGLSVSLLEQVPMLHRIMRRVRQAFGTGSPKIVIGGLATNEMQPLWRWLGADGWGLDAIAAIDLEKA